MNIPETLRNLTSNRPPIEYELIMAKDVQDDSHLMEIHLDAASKNKFLKMIFLEDDVHIRDNRIYPKRSMKLLFMASIAILRMNDGTEKTIKHRELGAS